MNCLDEYSNIDSNENKTSKYLKKMMKLWTSIGNNYGIYGSRAKNSIIDCIQETIELTEKIKIKDPVSSEVIYYRIITLLVGLIKNETDDSIAFTLNQIYQKEKAKYSDI